MEARYVRHDLQFKVPAGTSRGVMTQKETWYLVLSDGAKTGIGECGILRGLSADDRPDYEEKLQWVCRNIHLGKDELWTALADFPSIQFGVETAFASFEGDEPFELFPSEFTAGIKGISINGLVWMGDRDHMAAQITEKIHAGFDCVKLKIGAIDFNDELSLLKAIRDVHGPGDIEIRVDANGAFTPEDAPQKLSRLAAFDLHSIEQPIAAGQPDRMAEFCRNTPIPIALDEELIGVKTVADKQALLDRIRPQYIILKPSLIGGFRGTSEWINEAGARGIGWWITSALESNIGLNAIAQFTFTTKNPMPQGLGTGALYTNNIPSPLTVDQGKLFYRPGKPWEVSFL